MHGMGVSDTLHTRLLKPFRDDKLGKRSTPMPEIKLEFESVDNKAVKYSIKKR